MAFTICSMLTWGDWRLRAPVEPVLGLLAAGGYGWLRGARDRSPAGSDV